jgi:hypothetical protein
MRGAQQEAKARRESEAPAGGRDRRDSPVLRLCFYTKGGREGRRECRRHEYLCLLELKSWKAGERLHVVTKIIFLQFIAAKKTIIKRLGICRILFVAQINVQPVTFICATNNFLRMPK